MQLIHKESLGVRRCVTNKCVHIKLLGRYHTPSMSYIPFISDGGIMVTFYNHFYLQYVIE